MCIRDRDYTPEEILYLVDLAAELKDKKKKGILTKEMHQGKNIVLIFEKTSTPVSYTHLDVYKRQIYALSDFFGTQAGITAYQGS